MGVESIDIAAFFSNAEALAQGFASGAIFEEDDALVSLEEALDSSSLNGGGLHRSVYDLTYRSAGDNRELVEMLRPVIAGLIRQQAEKLNGVLAQARQNLTGKKSLFGDREKILAEARAALGRGKEPEVDPGQYRREKELGRGGYSTVYLATDQTTGQKVVIKVLHSRHSHYPAVVQEFYREAKVLMRLSHPGLVRVIGIGKNFGEERLPFFVMEYVEGESLDRHLFHKSPLSWGETKEILLQLCDALGFAHVKGVVHLDLKPENVLLTKGEGEKRTVKLIDFGIALDLNDPEQSAKTETRTFIAGTPHYMSPERIRQGGKVNFRSDIYSLGILMFEMLTGERPFDTGLGDSIIVLSKHLQETPPRPREVGRDLNIPECAEAIVLKALAKSPQDRFQSMAEMARAIKACE